MVDFSGRTVVCIASGPSLTKEDCDIVEASGHAVIAVNNSWHLAPFADVLYAGDYKWWHANINSITTKAERWTCSHYANDKYDINLHRIKGVEWNSGLRAIQFAECQGAERVILLGYDCSVDKGLHWHGPHEKTDNPNPNKCRIWKTQFGNVANATKIPIINCSRETALTCFPRADLEDTLCLKHFQAEKPLRMSSN